MITVICIVFGAVVVAVLLVLLSATWSAVEMGISDAANEYESRLEQKNEEISRLKDKARVAGV